MAIGWLRVEMARQMQTVMHLASRNGGVTTQELAAVLNRSNRQALRILVSLEAFGYLKSEKPTTRKGRRRGDWRRVFKVAELPNV
jgi:predicted transcriptional regulator